MRSELPLRRARAVVLAAVVGCAPSDGTVALQYCLTDPEPLPETTEVPTWEGGVAALVGEHCTACHTGDNPVGGLALQTVADFRAHSFEIRQAVASERMPPWSAEDCCGRDYRRSRDLAPAERSALLAWLDADLPASTEPAAATVTTDALPRVDVRVSPGEPYTAEARWGSTDVRCFVIPLPDGVQGQNVVASRVVPSNPAVIHHLFIAELSESRAQRLIRKDEADPGPGYACDPGITEFSEDAVAFYVPGAGRTELPEGVGRPLNKGRYLWMNIHYDVSHVPAGQSTTDLTTIELMLEPEVDRPLVAFSVAHPLWMYGSGMRLDGGMEETTYGFSWNPTRVLYPQARGMEIWGVFFHMHEWGRAGTMAVLREDGTQECLLYVDDWDFYWQSDYLYEQPVFLAAEDRVYVECSWVNPMADDMAWNATEEMCASTVFATEVR